MVQNNGTLSLQMDKGKRYLIFNPNPQVRLGDLQPLGFSPIQTHRTTISWRHIFHPALVAQMQNLYGPLEIESEYLEQLLLENSTMNYRRSNAEIIQKDTSLKSYQIPAALFLASKRKAFLALAPGLGKSLTALRAAQAAKYKYIWIVAPLSLLKNWSREIERWLPDTRIVTLLTDGTRFQSGNAEAKRLIILMSYDTFQRWDGVLNAKSRVELCIFDESILLKNRETKRFREIKKRLKEYHGSLWLLSGGPTAKFLDDMYAQLYLLDSKRFSSYWQFAFRYCIVQETTWGNRIIANQPGAVELLEKDISDMYYARTQDQVENLPPFIFENIEIEMEDNQAAMYQQMEKEFFAELPSGDEVIAVSVLTQILRLTQIASNASLLEDENIIPISSPKWSAVADLLSYVEGPVLIWTNFIRTASLLGMMLAHKRVRILTGQVEPADRQSVVEKFQRGELDVLIAHPAVGKFGHTLTRARTAIYVERSYNGDNYYQSLYRVRRIGTTHSPRIIHLLSTCGGRRTVDHAVDDVLRYRHENNVQMITGRILRQAWEGNL